MVQIKKELIETMCEAAKQAYPNEFFALLSSTQKNDIIDEYALIQAQSGKNNVIIQLHLMPIDFNILGSLHSHPSSNTTPSKADLRTFKKTGKVHIIIGYPFTTKTAKMFDVNGKHIEMQIID